MFQVGSGDVLNFVASDDPMYNLRQTEQMLANFPGYGWFDAMTLYPFGMSNFWGPLTIYFCSIACLIAGAATRPEIISTALLIPPLMAVIMVPYCIFSGGRYWTGKQGFLLHFS
jgi:dolichyl-diphosphooligosaccharide--protein glycosyltransferase